MSNIAILLIINIPTTNEDLTRAKTDEAITSFAKRLLNPVA